MQSLISYLKYLLDFCTQVYSYREYLKQSVIRDLRNKYKRSMFGYLWTMLHPLAMMVILAIVFSHIMRISTKDYAVFLFAALLPWNYFNSTCLMSLHSIRANARLFSQVPIPKYIFVLSIAASNLVNLLLAIVPLLVVMIVTGRSVPMTILALPVVLLPLICVTIGLSLVLATSNVFFEDTLHLSEVFLQALYFLSPVLYSRDMLPKGLVKYLTLNPLFSQIEFIRGVVYDGVLPNLEGFAINLAGSLVVLFIGLIIFKSSEDKFLYFI